MLEQGRQVPFSGQRVVNADEFGQLLERMRINVPSSIRESERTLAERDAILAEAHGEAERIIEQSKQHARDMLSKESLMAAAQREAERIIEASRNASLRRTEEADRYATEVLQDLAAKLEIITQQVSNGLRIMQDNALSVREVSSEQLAQDEQTGG